MLNVRREETYLILSRYVLFLTQFATALSTNLFGIPYIGAQLLNIFLMFICAGIVMVFGIK